ncbi:hypothetical protein HBI21_037080 [Parastagonospora nodorum]|nr:hypothetical protein HBI21_037080 [Parastagonospora nodorum]
MKRTGQRRRNINQLAIPCYIHASIRIQNAKHKPASQRREQRNVMTHSLHLLCRIHEIPGTRADHHVNQHISSHFFANCEQRVYVWGHAAAGVVGAQLDAVCSGLGGRDGGGWGEACDFEGHFTLGRDSEGCGRAMGST